MKKKLWHINLIFSQNISKKNFCFIPALEKYEGRYTDKQLCEMWGITNGEYKYIESRIGEIGEKSNG